MNEGREFVISSIETVNMVYFIAGLVWIFGSPFSVIVFGTGVIVGYLLSENQRTKRLELEQAYDELNEILLEKEGRIDKLEAYIDQLHQRQIEEPASSKEGVVKSAPQKEQDLTRIEGIGPKTADILFQSGIKTYKELSETSIEALTQILEAAGPAFLRHNHETWAKQALLAANDEWEALDAWQKG